MLRNGLEPWHIVILAIVILILFGWKKMPDMARSFGRSARILRSEVDEMKNDKKTDRKTEPAGHSATAGAQPANAEHTTTPANPDTPGDPTVPAAGVRVEHDVPTRDPAGPHTTA